MGAGDPRSYWLGERNPPSRRHAEIWEKLLSVGLSVVGGLLMAYLAAQMLDPNREERKRKKQYAEALYKRLGRRIQLSPMELLLADAVVNPKEIEVDPSDIYGLKDLQDDLMDKVVRPLNYSRIYSTTLWRQTRGLLLYGPPGTGKTMIAKALAKSCDCFFMNVSSSSIMSKWYGDAQKLVRAIFTLAEKLQPCIIFIDEVDSVLTARGGHSEHEATLGIKTEFMQWWEGMATRSGTRVLVMGATNRKDALDPAVLRRFTVQYKIALPEVEQRFQIVWGYLEKHFTETGQIQGQDIRSVPLMSDRAVRDGLSALKWIAKHTENFSGSDLHELCAQAAKIPLNEAIQQAENGEMNEITPEEALMIPRDVTLEDFEEAMKSVKPVAIDRREDGPSVYTAQDGLLDLFMRTAAMHAANSAVPKLTENGENGENNEISENGENSGHRANGENGQGSGS